MSEQAEGRNWGGGARWGVDVPGLGCPPPTPSPSCPGGRFSYQRQKRLFLPARAGPEVQTAPPSPGVCSRWDAGCHHPQDLRGVPRLGGGLTAVGGAPPRREQPCGGWIILTQGRPLWRSHLSCSAPPSPPPYPDEMAAGTSGRTPGRGLGLSRVTAGGPRPGAHPPHPTRALSAAAGRPVFQRTAFQPGIRHLPDDLDPAHEQGMTPEGPVEKCLDYGGV